MTKREQLTGVAMPLNDEQLAAVAFSHQKPYPLGIPRRIVDAIRNRCEAFAREVVDPLMNPHEVKNLMPSDVPGVLIEAGIEEIFASLSRIHKAKGFQSADNAYRQLLARALADGRDDIAAEMTRRRQQVARAMQGEKIEYAKRATGDSILGANEPSTRVRDLMQQKADAAQAQAQTARLTEPEENARKRAEFEKRRDAEAQITYRGKTNYGQH